MKEQIQIAREEVITYGADNASLHSLLSIVLGKTVKPETIGKLTSLGIVQLSQMSEFELMQFEGITKNKAIMLCSSFGLAKKLQQYSYDKPYIIRSPEDAANYLMHELRFANQEHFIGLYLNTKNHVLRKKTLFIGTLNAAVVHPRDVFREALSLSAASIVVAHNHPSTDCGPSKEDIEITKRLVECGKLMGIDVLDHLIIGDNKFTSLKEKGYV
jgi:DNA repair protein RadC